MAVTPHFFYISDISNSSTFSGKNLRKKSMLENFRANVLKVPTSATPNEVDPELVRKKSLGFWMGCDVKSGIAKSC